MITLASSLYSYAGQYGCLRGFLVGHAATAPDDQFADMDLTFTGKEVGRVKVLPPLSQWALPISPLCYLPLPWVHGALPLPAGPHIRHQALTVQPLTLGLRAQLPLSHQILLLPSARC